MGWPNVCVVAAIVIFDVMTKLDGHVSLMDASGRMLGGSVADGIGLGAAVGEAVTLVEGDALGDVEGLEDADGLALALLGQPGYCKLSTEYLPVKPVCPSQPVNRSNASAGATRLG